MLTAGIGLAHLIDGVIAFTLLECLGLAILSRKAGRVLAPRDFLANITAGLCLMLALRSLVSDPDSTWVAVFLLGAGVAHGFDMRGRWKRRAVCATATARACA